MNSSFVITCKEITVEELEWKMSRREGCVATALDVAPAIGGERDIGSGVVTEDGGGVNDKSACHIFLEVVARDFTLGEMGEGEFVLLCEMSLLKTDDVTLRDKIGEGMEDKISARETRFVSNIRRKAVDVVGEESWDESRAIRERSVAGRPI